MKTYLNKHMTFMFMTVLPLAFLTGCATNPPPTVASVDLARYAGKWYEIAKYPVIFESGLYGVTAEYTLRNDGTVRIQNKGFKGALDGPESSILGVASAPDPADTAKLRIKFDPFPVSLFKADYWIIDLGEEYDYAVVSNPRRNTLWILCRTPQMEPALYEQIVQRLNTLGFDAGKLELMPQP